MSERKKRTHVVLISYCVSSVGRDSGALSQESQYLLSPSFLFILSPNTKSSFWSAEGWQGEQSIALARQVVCVLRL